jgi:hypothetical protein
MSLIPTKKQWQAWSLPSKLGATGTLVTILAFGAYVTDQFKIPHLGFIFLNEGTDKVVVRSTGEIIVKNTLGYAGGRDPSIQFG